LLQFSFYTYTCTLYTSKVAFFSISSLQGCQVGSYGTLCNLTCPGGQSCENRLCSRYIGDCIDCVPYRWGGICDQTCPNCVNGECGQEDGICVEGCVPGFYGPQCNARCHSRCYECDRGSGDCLVCDIGTFGNICQNNCSGNCRNDVGQNFVTCGKENGWCTSGACWPGYFSRDCESACSSTCKANNTVLPECSIDVGDCSHGCIIGYYGPTCSRQCSNTCRNKHCIDHANNCIEGCVDNYFNFPTCDLLCNTNCLQDTCLDNGGNCTFGCEPGFYGGQCALYCQQTCINGTCDRRTGRCAECDLAQPGFECRTASKFGMPSDWVKHHYNIKFTVKSEIIVVV